MSETDQFDFEEIRNALAIYDDEAEKRYKDYKSTDPFPDIAPALLNTADIIDYVIATGMIHPFRPEKAKLKPASYAVAVKGEFIYWDEENKEHSGKIDEGDSLTLRKNSITYVALEPYLRLPEYIALRFNLKISFVYKGLLVGTGPLVDPGYKGNLYLPLHNLTNNDYHLKYDEDLIYIEFTKLSPIDDWKKRKANIDRRGFYVPLDLQKYKGRVALRDYIFLANQGNSIASSIPEAIQVSRDSAETAKRAAKESADRAEKLEKSSKKFSFIGISALILTALLLAIEILVLNSQTNEYIRNVQRDQLNIKKELSDKYSNEVGILKQEILILNNKVDSLINNSKIIEDEKINKSEK